ncbi:PfkB family carbohydrate kinase [Thalassoglobus sp. JC818]|uniref:1-phosphofructokinase family hexose kinase n=1 Tax=Thalassoglobus sp. JC818 TaxID=3232136 RepID=UPI0034599136
MIFVAGLSPAWQQIMEFEKCRWGEVNRARSVNWCASGKVLNVAIAVHHLGADTTVATAVGGPSGAAIEDEFDSFGIRKILLDAGSPTRVCTTLLEDSGVTTELVENTAGMPLETIEEFHDQYRTYSSVATVAVLTGSMPSGVGDDFYARLIQQIPTETILDFRGPGLLNCLPWGPFLVKPNREELSQTLQRPLNDEAELISAMRELNKRGAQAVVVSDGPKSLYVTTDDHQLRFIPPQVEVVNPIGCGDCLAAGIATARCDGASLIDAVRFGMGAAAMNAGMLLPGRLDREAVSELADQVEVEEVR